MAHLIGGLFGAFVHSLSFNSNKKSRRFIECMVIELQKLNRYLECIYLLVPQ